MVSLPNNLGPSWYRELANRMASSSQPWSCCASTSFALEWLICFHSYDKDGVTRMTRRLCHDISFFSLVANIVGGDKVYSLVYHNQQELEPVIGKTWSNVNLSLTFAFPGYKSVIWPHLPGERTVWAVRWENKGRPGQAAKTSNSSPQTSNL